MHICTNKIDYMLNVLVDAQAMTSKNNKNVEIVQKIVQS